MYKDTLLDYLGEFIDELAKQMKADQERWGDTWKKRRAIDQAERIFDRFKDYYDQYVNGGTPIPWMKIAGLSLIAWVRDREAYVA